MERAWANTAIVDYQMLQKMLVKACKKHKEVTSAKVLAMDKTWSGNRLAIGAVMNWGIKEGYLKPTNTTVPNDSKVSHRRKLALHISTIYQGE